MHRHGGDARVRVLLHRWWGILCAARWAVLSLHQSHLILHEQALALEVLARSRLMVELLSHDKCRFALLMLLTSVTD